MVGDAQIGTGRMNPSTHQYWEDSIDCKASTAPADLAKPQVSSGSSRGTHGQGQVASGSACQGAQAVLAVGAAHATEAQQQGLKDHHASTPAAEAGQRLHAVAGRGAASFGAGALFRSSVKGGQSASCKAQTKLSNFVTVSESTRQSFKPPRGAHVSGRASDRDVLDDKTPWWSAAARTRGGAAGGKSASACDHMSDCEEGAAYGDEEPAAGQGERAVGPPREGSAAASDAHLADAESVADAQPLLGKRLLGARGGGSGLKRFKTANPFANAPPSVGVASKFFGATSTGVPARGEERVEEGGGSRSAGNVTRAVWSSGDSKADEGRDVEEQDRQARDDAIEAAMQGLAYRAHNASAAVSGAAPPRDHRYVSTLVLPTRSSSSSSLLRRNSSTASASPGAARNLRAQLPVRSLSDSHTGGITIRTGSAHLAQSNRDKDGLNEAVGGGISSQDESEGDRSRGRSGPSFSDCRPPTIDCSRASRNTSLADALVYSTPGGTTKNVSQPSSARPPATLVDGRVARGGARTFGQAGGERQRLSLPHRGPSSRGAFSATSIEALACFALGAPASAGRLQR